jgi:hypothetical protein
MDPVTLVVTATALGASAGLKETAAQAVKDAYAGLKSLLTRRRIDLAEVERKPDSENKQQSLRKDLHDLDGTPDAVDDSLLDAARQLIAAVEAHDPGAAQVIGIDLEEFQAESLRVSGLSSDGTGVRGRNWRIAGDAVFENIHAGRTPVNPSALTEAGGSSRPS